MRREATVTSFVEFPSIANTQTAKSTRNGAQSFLCNIMRGLSLGCNGIVEPRVGDSGAGGLVSSIVRFVLPVERVGYWYHQSIGRHKRYHMPLLLPLNDTSET